MSDEGPGDLGALAPPGELGPRAPLAISDLVTTLDVVRATRSRTAKIEALAALFARTLPDEAEAVVGLLLGRIRQGRIGLGRPELTLDPQAVDDEDDHLVDDEDDDLMDDEDDQLLDDEEDADDA